MKNKKSLFATIALAGVVGLAGTLAYFAQEMSVENKLGTKSYGSELVEKFTPEFDWKPGATVDKEVKVKNTGDYDIVARVTWDEEWTNKKTEATIVGGSFAGYEPASTNFVTKNYADMNNWVYGNDGYAYYKTPITAKGESTNFLNSITLDSDIVGDANGMKQVTRTYYTTSTVATEDEVAENEWIELHAGENIPSDRTYVKVVTTTEGPLADANYTLTITVQVIQNTAEALAGDTNWKTVDTEEERAALGLNW